MDDATRQLIESLQQEVRRLRAANQRLGEENQLLRDRLEQAEREAARQAAPFRRPQRQKKDPSQKKRPGRSKGHKGQCRVMPERIDEVIDVPLDGCPCCGGPVTAVQVLEQVIEEIEPARVRAVKLTTYEGQCVHCGSVFSTHPLQTSRAGGAAKVQLGPRALALAVTLNKQHGLTMRKTCRVLQDLCGLKLSAGGLSQALARVAGKVRGEYAKLINQLRQSAAVNADETSWWVGGPGWWLWSFSDATTTVYRVDHSRGSDVVAQTLGEDFAGVLVSDCLSSYDPSPYRKHKCIAHHLRAIAKARDAPGQHDPTYLDQWVSLFNAVIILHRLREQFDPADFAAKRAHLQQQADQLLDQPVSQPGDLAVRNRLVKQRAHLLVCLDEPAAEPTNNRAERDLRPAVIARKLSCGNKTPRGSDTWQTLASLAATCVKRAIDLSSYLIPRLALRPAPG